MQIMAAGLSRKRLESLRASHCYVHSHRSISGKPQKMLGAKTKSAINIHDAMLVCVHLKNLHLSFPLFRFRQRHQAKSIEGIQHQNSTGTLSKPKTTQNLGVWLDISTGPLCQRKTSRTWHACADDLGVGPEFFCGRIVTLTRVISLTYEYHEMVLYK